MYLILASQETLLAQRETEKKLLGLQNKSEKWK